MKKILSAIIMAIGVFCASCTDTEEFYETTSLPQSNEGTRAEGVTYFDNCDQCVLSSGETVRTPWAEFSVGSIPTDVRQDVKEINGWRILYSNVNIIGYDHQVNYVAPNCDYLVLYNKYTGVMKGFYYARQAQGNNHVYWTLTVPESNTKLFNFTLQNHAVPMNESVTNKIIVSNVTTDGVGGLTQGWNCFITPELAYDPNSMNQHLNIQANAINSAQYDFSGNYHSVSEGTIITSTNSQNPVVSSLIDGFATCFGDSAESWLLGDSAIKGISNTLLNTVINSGPAALISFGLNKIFGSFLGTSSTSTKNIQFTTKGSVTVSGNSTQPMTGYIMPLSGMPLGGIGENLGVWNLTETPRYEITSYPLLKKVEQNYGHVDYFYRVEGCPVINYVVNPSVDASKHMTYSIVCYQPYLDNHTTYEPSFKEHGLNLVNMYGLNKNLIYNDGDNQIFSMPQNYIVVGPDVVPNRATPNNKPTYDFEYSNYDIRQNMVFKVVLHLSNHINTYSSKTFYIKSKYNMERNARPRTYTYSELKSLGY